MTCAGIIIVASTNQNSGWRPRNSYFAKTYPSSELVNSVAITTVTATNREFR